MVFALLLVCFFLSGFSALLYETAWTREFAFVFGTSELAVVAVLAAYMGGLALGAAVAARLAPRVRRPILVYGVLELAIALWALALPVAVRAVRAVYLSWLGGLDAMPEALGLATHAFHLAGAFLVLVPCTALMGATLPLLARHAVTRDEQIGPRVGLLYAVNTIGAIGGTLAAAFVLLPALGLRQTVMVGAVVNLGVFAAAAALARAAGPASEKPPSPPSRGVPWVLPAIAVSGLVSFSHEVLWFRMLGQLLGASTAAFSTMLACFLAGIALGSAIASRWAKTREAAAIGFTVAQLATAAMAVLGFAGMDRLPALAVSLDASVNALGPGALVAMTTLLPLTLCIGSTFPFAVRLLARDANDTTSASARVYAWNTVGSILGAVGCGYLWMPALGLAGTLALGVALNLVLAAVSAFAVRPVRKGLVAATAVVAVLFAVFVPTRPEELLRTSPLGNRYDGDLDYFSVGRSSTVALFNRGLVWRLATNGLPESLISAGGYPLSSIAAHWLSLLPVAVRPDVEDMLIIGLGGAATLSAVPGSVERIEVVELEPEVVAANRSIEARAMADGSIGNPLDDPRLELRVGDARGIMILSDHRYDAIVSQPSHPWTSGASHLYTREFFELVRSRLSTDGVFVQWIGGSFVDRERLASLLAAFSQTFAHSHVFRPTGGAIVMLGSPAPMDLLASGARAIAASPEAFGGEGVHRVEDLAAAWVLDSEGSRRIAGDAPANSDDFNRLATSRQPSKNQGPWLERVMAPYDALAGREDGLALAPLARRLQMIGHGRRGLRLAAGLDPARGELVRGWLAIEAHAPRRAARHLQASVEADPDSLDARIGLALADPRVATDDLPPRAVAVIEARRLGPDGWEQARAVDTALAEWKPGELLFREAAELRVLWRYRSGDPEAMREALALLEPMIERIQLPRYLFMQAELRFALEEFDQVWLSLAALGYESSRQAPAALATRALALADELGPAPHPDLVIRLQRAAGRRQTGVAPVPSSAGAERPAAGPSARPDTIAAEAASMAQP